MYKYLDKLFENIKIYNYNYWNDNNKSNKIYKNLELDSDIDNISLYLDNKIKPIDVCDKKLRLNILLYIKQYKNTYYKYTNKEKFNIDLYNSFINDENFDDSLTAYDDDEPNIRIFDKYILEYIKKRNDIITYLQCKDKGVILHDTLESLNDLKKSNTYDMLFIIDMNERDLLSYCLEILSKVNNISLLKTLIFSMIIKYDGNHIRIKIDTSSKNKNYHPYLILEKYI
jgi:hypothetical protein